MFSVHTLKSVFATCSWRISKDGRSNRGNKAAFSNFSGRRSVNSCLNLTQCKMEPCNDHRTVHWSPECNCISGLLFFVLVARMFPDHCWRLLSQDWRYITTIFSKNSHYFIVWFPSVEDFSDEFRRKGILFNRALEDLENRAKKCESLKILVSWMARDGYARLWMMLKWFIHTWSMDVVFLCVFTTKEIIYSFRHAKTNQKSILWQPDLEMGGVTPLLYWHLNLNKNTL